MSDQVGLEIDDHGSYATVRASGYLDLSSSPQLREKLHDLAERDMRAVIVDLGSIEFIDSSALGVILSGWKAMNARGGRLAVVSPEHRIANIFEVTGLTLSIGLYPSVDAAVEALGV